MMRGLRWARILPVACALFVISSLFTGCKDKEAESKIAALQQQVDTLTLEAGRLKRDVELKNQQLDEMKAKMAQSDAALAAVRLGLTEPTDRLLATMKTNQGTVVMELDWKNAPQTVANFVGLAEGTKAFADPKTGEQVKRAFYDGLTFHRVIPGFMIQGGDPQGDGRGGPGYKFGDEIVDSLTFDKPGILAMANAGPNTNGSQFFITTGSPTHLNGRHTIFGSVVSGMDVVEKISNVPRGEADRPNDPVIIETMTITREKAAPAAPVTTTP